jgi:hypothetical protein
MCHDHDFWQAFAYLTNNSIGAIMLDYLAMNAPRLQSALYKRGALPGRHLTFAWVIYSLK